MAAAPVAYPCDLCAATLGTRRAAIAHMRKVHDTGLLPSEWEIRVNVRKRFNPQFKCAFEGCHKAYQRKDTLKSHQLQCHGRLSKAVQPLHEYPTQRKRPRKQGPEEAAARQERRRIHEEEMQQDLPPAPVFNAPRSKQDGASDDRQDAASVNSEETVLSDISDSALPLYMKHVLQGIIARLDPGSN